VAITDQQMIEAQMKTGRAAMECLEAIAAFGDTLSISAQKPYDLKTDEYITLRMKTEQFRSLMQMFTEVSEYVKGFVSFDSIEEVNEFIESSK